MSNDLIIQMPRQGSAPSAHVGFGTIQNLDMFSVPGVARLNKIMSLTAGTVTTSPNWIVKNPLNTSEFFALGNTGVVYTATDGLGDTWSTLTGNSSSGVSGNGLAIWKDYLFVARDANLDTFGPLSGRTCTAITNATPGVVQFTAHGFSTQDGTTVIFSTSGSLPTGLVVGTVYFMGTVHNANEFSVSATQGGGDIATSSAGSGTHKFRFWRSSTSPALTFKALTSDVDWHPMLVSKLDGRLYGGNANQVFKLTELTTFDPTASATYTFSTGILSTALPSDYRIKCLAELGTNIMLGTWKGTNVYDYAVADIFPVDPGSAVVVTGNPIIMNDFGVHAMLTFGSSLIIWAGINGRVYRSDGVNFSEVARLPIDVDATSEWITWYPGAVCVYKGRIFFGASGGTSGSSTLSPLGVYSLQFTSRENILVLEHTNSQETTGSAEVVNVSSLLPAKNQRLLVGFTSASTFGLDITHVSSYAYTTAYTGFFDTPLYQVGTPKSKRIFTELDLLLAKVLATGEGVKIQYRTTYNGTYADVGTYTHDIAGTTKLGAVFTHFVNANVPVLETVQFRIALKGTATTTPALKTVTFR